MQRSITRLLEGLTLTVVLALVVLVAHWTIAVAPGFTQPAATPTSIASVTETYTPTPTPTPSRTPTSTPTSTPTPRPTATSTPTSTPTNTPTSTPTPTPYRIKAPINVPSPVPLLVPTEDPSPTPLVLTSTQGTRDLFVPTPVPLAQLPPNTLNILLLGSDQESIKSIGRTDTILIASINLDLPSVALLSIPRDFYAWIPGHGFGKINTAFSRGASRDYADSGPALMKATIEYNFGIRVHYYARVGFQSFIRIVDELGGVDVAVECALHDTFPDPSSPEGQTDIDLLPGIHHLEGKQALWYARSRWSTSDFDRHRRQQQVLRGLYRQVMTLGIIPKIPSLWGTLKENVATDLGLDELLYLGAIGSQLELTDVKSGFVGRGAVASWTAPDGTYVLVPDYEALGPLVSQALAPPARARAQQRAFRVEVSNAAPYQGWGHVAAERLRWEGFEVVDVQRSDGTYPRTKIIDFTTTAKGSPLPQLMRLYGRQADDVISQPAEERDVDFRVILGTDYDPCRSARGY